MKKIKLLFYSLIFILTSFNSVSQIFELTITSKLLGDEVLKVGSTIYIEGDNNTIENTTGGDGMYVPSVTYTLVMKGISLNGVRLNANFNIDNNPWGTPGTITADFSTKKLRFQSWSLEDRAQSGVYYFTSKIKTKEDIAEEKERREKERQAQELLNRKSDKEKYPIIDNALAKGNIELCKKTINRLHYPKSYPNYKAYEKMEDEYLLSKLDSLIANNQFEQAAKDFSKLHEKRSDLRINISEALAKKISSEKISRPLSDKRLSQFIKNNKTKFNGYPEGTYKLTIDPTGVVFIDDKQIFNDSTFVEYKTFGIGSNFKMPIFTETDLEIKISKKINIPEYVAVSTKKNIYKSLKGDYYINGFFTFSIFSEYVKTSYDPKVKEKHYQIRQRITETISVNGIEASSLVKDQILQEKRFKRRWLKAVGRSFTIIGVAAYLYWGSTLDG